MTQVGIQGGEASYHEMAAQQLHDQPELAYYETFGELFGALREGRVGSAVVALANNSSQFVHDPFEELVHGNRDLSIVGETYVRVQHALMAPKGATIEDVQEVHSQTPALIQCSGFLREVLPKAVIIEEHDTAGSAKMVADLGDRTKAAIASTQAAERYGLDLLRTSIQDQAANITRFLELQLATESQQTIGNKTTMLLKTADVVGALADALTLFKDAGINLDNIQSRIIPDSAFDVDFFLEFLAGVSEERVQSVLRGLDHMRHKYHILGSYQRAEIPMDEV